MRNLAVISSSVLAFSIPLAAGAEPPSGSYLIPVGGDHALVLPTEIGSPACETEDGVTVCFSGAISVDASGNITGAAAAEYSGDVSGNLAATFRGTVGGSTADTKLRLAMTMAGEVSSGGATLDVKARGRWRCVEDTAASRFRCSGRLKRCLFDGRRHLGCESEPSDLYLADGGGPWHVYLELATDAKGIVGGTAVVFLSNGLMPEFNLSGRYNSRTDTAKLRLVGAGDARGSELELSQLSLSDGTAAAGQLRYRIAGQRGRTLLPAPSGQTGEPFPGHGTCIRGGFCDANADTGGLFSGHGGGGSTGTIADTIFFPILSAD